MKNNITISHNIKIGLTYKGFCDYYNTISSYVLQLQSCDIYDESKIAILECLIIEEIDEDIITTYYIKNTNSCNYISYINRSNKISKNTEWVFVDAIEHIDIEQHLSKCPYILDMDYYLKNN